MGSARRLVAAAVLCTSLAVAVAAVDRAPRAVGQQCPVPTQETILVEPVLSPTDRLTQTVGARFGNYGQWIKVVTESGVFTNTQVPGAWHAAVDIELLPGVTHHLTVSGRVALGGSGGLCPRIEYELATTQDLNGTPLVIVQSDQATPSATPSPDMLHDVQVSGDVVALGTPVSARILLHPSDGRCPWSDGYRCGEDGRLDRTCSDARQGSTIGVWILGDHHDPWSRSYEVERGDHGAKPIEVRAILTARPVGASPTPTVVDEIGETRWFGNVVQEGGVPVPWASVSVDASGYGVSCLSPVNTDDAGHFEVWCFGGHSLYTDFRVAARASGCEPWEAAMGRVSTGDVRLRDIELVCATSTPTATPTPPWSGIYVPAAYRLD